MMTEKLAQKRFPSWLPPLFTLLVGVLAGGGFAIGSYNRPHMRLAGHNGDIELTSNVQLEPATENENETGSENAVMDLIGSDFGSTEVASPPDVSSVPDGKPKVYLPKGNEHDFGIMARNEKKSFSFPVRNLGRGPLTLKVIGSTCKCTVGSLEDDSIPSGETRPVTLTWEAKSYAEEFRQSATIETNDRSVREIVFSVFGKVVQLAMPDLPMVQFKVRQSETKSFSTKVYGYRDDDLLITDHEFLHEDLGKFFDVTYHPLPKEEWDDKNATSAIRCDVSIKPGLPLGQVTQGLRLHTNKDDIAPLAISVDMHVVSDISLDGPGLNTRNNLLTMNHVDGDTGKTMPLQILVKGKYKEQAKFSIAKADPEGVLTAEFGEPVDLKRTIDGVETVIARTVPFKVIVKKGSYGVSRMGNEQGDFGVLTINTNHPEVKQFDVKVRFVVKNRETTVQ